MMNKDDKIDDATAAGRDLSVAIMDTSDDRKPPAKVVLMGGGKQSAPLSPDSKVKRKRRSPEKPWKKPADMPKRPLSAYNIFFRDERERLLSAGPEGKQGVREDVGGGEVSTGGKKQKKPSGIGFANLAKTIASRWKELDDGVRAPYEKIAAAEKKKYDELVAEWRIKEGVKKKAQALAKKEAADVRKSAPMREPVVPNLFSSERSLGSFSDTSNPYPSEWFHAAPEMEGSERDDSRGSVPPIVETSPRASYDRRAYDSSMPSPAWQHPRQDPYYHQHHHQNYGPSDHYMRYSSEEQRNAYLNQNLFAPEISMRASPSAPVVHPGYRDYYHHSQQSIYQPAGRYSEMRLPRAASLPISRHGDPAQQHQSHHAVAPPQYLHPPEDIQEPIEAEVVHGRSARESSSRYRHHHQQRHYSSPTRGSAPHPRSASMPHAQHPSTPPERGSGRRRSLMSGGGEEVPDRSTLVQALTQSDPTGSRRRPPLANPDLVDPAATPNEESFIVETSLHSLTESLDEDAISFITSMKYS